MSTFLAGALPLAILAAPADHSTTVYLMDRKGRFSDVIGYNEPDAGAIAKLRGIIHE